MITDTMQPVTGEKPITVRLDPKDYRDVEAEAKRQVRSVSGQIVFIVRAWLERERAAKQRK